MTPIEHQISQAQQMIADLQVRADVGDEDAKRQITELNQELLRLYQAKP